jgi:hypothetical protein
MSDHAAMIPGALVERQVRCPDCGRYLGTSYLPGGALPGDGKAKLHCGRCRKWRLCELVPGTVQEG